MSSGYDPSDAHVNKSWDSTVPQVSGLVFGKRPQQAMLSGQGISSSGSWETLELVMID